MTKIILLGASVFLSSSLYAWSLNSALDDVVNSATKKEKIAKKEKVEKKEMSWREYGFGSGSKSEWQKYVSSPKEAKSWIKSLNLSVNSSPFKRDPEIANSWIQSGFNTDDAAQWNKLGLGAKWSKSKIDAGISFDDAQKLEPDELLEYFQNIVSTEVAVKKGDITFAGMGQHLGFKNMIKKICKIKSFTTIDGYAKEKYCAPKSPLVQALYHKPTLDRPLSPTPSDISAMKNWGNLLGAQILGKTKVKDKIVSLTSFRKQTIIAKPLTLKGVDFEVHFSYIANRNDKVLAGMLLDGNVPMTYYTVPNDDRSLNRFVTYFMLDKIELKPLSHQLFRDQSEELIEMFTKKFPKIVRGKRTLTYKYNGDRFKIWLSQNSIEYQFDGNFGLKYMDLYTKKQKEKLAEKNDDSDSI